MIRFAIVFLVALLASPLHADELRPAVVELREIDAWADESRWVLEWKLPITASRAGGASPSALPIIPESCAAVGEARESIFAMALLGGTELLCKGDLGGERFGLEGLAGAADAIARFAAQDRPVQTFRLTAASPSATILAEPRTGAVLRDYFIIGAEHILFGWDHLLFVIALVLLLRAPWPVVKAATAFTIAHSITLIATILGYAGLPGRAVEALIALSIVFLAVEVALVLREPDRQTWTRRYPWAVAFGFGLFHGFGFAGALADIGLPSGEVASALLAFNGGVEAGQLLVVGAAVLVLAFLSRGLPRAQGPALMLATYAIGSVGSFWLIERVVG